jgi:hypothetical protein
MTTKKWILPFGYHKVAKSREKVGKKTLSVQEENKRGD